MKKIYMMIFLTNVFFLLSINVLFPSNLYLDIVLVLLYLLLVSQFSLNLGDNDTKEKEEYILLEKKTSLFAPMIFMPFLGLAYNYGIVFFIINLLVIVLLYGYVLISLKRNKITITKEGISVVYINNKKDSMLFSEVDKVEFNWIYNYIGLCTDSGKRIILDITLKDFSEVIKALKINVVPEMRIHAFSKLSKFYKAFLMNSNCRYLE